MSPFNLLLSFDSPSKASKNFAGHIMYLLLDVQHIKCLWSLRSQYCSLLFIQVALRRKQSGHRVSASDAIPYIICVEKVTPSLLFVINLHQGYFMLLQVGMLLLYICISFQKRLEILKGFFFKSFNSCNHIFIRNYQSLLSWNL